MPQTNYGVLINASSGNNNAGFVVSEIKKSFAKYGIDPYLKTGGTLRFTVLVNRNETDDVDTLLNPFYSSDAVAQLTHPLLRNAGVFVTTQGIRLAFYGYQQ